MEGVTEVGSKLAIEECKGFEQAEEKGEGMTTHLAQPERLAVSRVAGWLAERADEREGENERGSTRSASAGP